MPDLLPERCTVERGSTMEYSHGSQDGQGEHAQVGEAIPDECVDGRNTMRGNAGEKEGG
jgi:hypothetical protein